MSRVVDADTTPNPVRPDTLPKKLTMALIPLVERFSGYEVFTKSTSIYIIEHNSNLKAYTNGLRFT